MKISVGSRSGRSGNQPHRLCLGRCSLRVTAVLNHHEEGASHAFEVRVLDGRRFLVRHQTELDLWELISVHGRGASPKPPARPREPLVGPLLLALVRRAMKSANRARKWKRDLPTVVPGGGAPA
jgi:hypothetical protein